MQDKHAHGASVPTRHKQGRHRQRACILLKLLYNSMLGAHCDAQTVNMHLWHAQCTERCLVVLVQHNIDAPKMFEETEFPCGDVRLKSCRLGAAKLDTGVSNSNQSCAAAPQRQMEALALCRGMMTHTDSRMPCSAAIQCTQHAVQRPVGAAKVSSGSAGSCGVAVPAGCNVRPGCKCCLNSAHVTGV